MQSRADHQEIWWPKSRRALWTLNTGTCTQVPCPSTCAAGTLGVSTRSVNMAYQTARDSGKLHLSSVHPSGAGRKCLWQDGCGFRSYSVGASMVNKKTQLSKAPWQQNPRKTPFHATFPPTVHPAQSTAQHRPKALANWPPVTAS